MPYWLDVFLRKFKKISINMLINIKSVFVYVLFFRFFAKK